MNVCTEQNDDAHETIATHPTAEPSLVADPEAEQPVAEPEETGKRGILIDPKAYSVPVVCQQITEALLDSGAVYLRAGKAVWMHAHGMQVISDVPSLNGTLSGLGIHAIAKKGKDRTFVVLPANIANTWMKMPDELYKLPVISTFAKCPLYVQVGDASFRLVGGGYDEVTGIYIQCKPIEPRTGTAHLDMLLREFCWRSQADRVNYLGALLTTHLMPQFIGAHPAILFNGNQPELGKSILANTIAILRDGESTGTVTFNSKDDEFEKRIGAEVKRGATTIVVDNAKTANGHKIESPCLERVITSQIASFRLLGKSEVIEAENSIVFCITANSADVSADLVSRSLVVNLSYQGSPKNRAFALADPEGFALANRAAIIGELLGMVERWQQAGCPRANVATRFNKADYGGIIGGILEANGLPGFMTNTDRAAGELDDTRREFAELVEVMALAPAKTWTPSELAARCISEKLFVGNLDPSRTNTSNATRFGRIASRFVDERFEVSGERIATFCSEETRNGRGFKLAFRETLALKPGLDSRHELPNVQNSPNSISGHCSAP